MSFHERTPRGQLQMASEAERREIRVRALAAAEIESRLRPLAKSGDTAAIAELEAVMEFEIEILRLAERQSSWTS